MSVSGTTNRISYAGNGVTVVFSFPYYLVNNTDLKVIETDTTTKVQTVKVLGVDFTLAFIGSAVNGVYPLGANITMGVATPTLTTITLYREPPRTQGLHLTSNDSFPSGSQEVTFDKAVLLIQRLRDLADRSIRLKDGDVSNIDLTLPEDLPANYLLGINPTGTGLVVSPAGPAGLPGPPGPAGPAGSSGMSPVSINITSALTPGAPPNGQYIYSDVTAGSIVLTLPLALGNEGQIFQIKKLDATANTVTVSAQGGDVVELAASKVISLQGDSYKFIARAAGFWDII